MMEEKICSIEVAKLAKEKGFNEPTVRYFINGDCKNMGISRYLYCHNDIDDDIAAPTQSLLQRWLREKKGYYVYPFFDNNELKWTWVCREKTGDMWIPLVGETPYFDTYEQALEDALKYSLENWEY